KKVPIPDEARMFHADIVLPPGGIARIGMKIANRITRRMPSVDDMQKIRRAFPKSIITLAPVTGKLPYYTPAQIDELIRSARAIGGPIGFPLRAEFATPEVVARLKPYGFVAIWNEPKTFNPKSIPEAEAQFRAMGVDGYIDLRRVDTPQTGA